MDSEGESSQSHEADYTTKIPTVSWRRPFLRRQSTRILDDVYILQRAHCMCVLYTAAASIMHRVPHLRPEI